jgi:hypothetical protein
MTVSAARDHILTPEERSRVVDLAALRDENHCGSYTVVKLSRHESKKGADAMRGP